MDAIIGSDVYTLYQYLPGRLASEMADAFAAVGLTEEADAIREINSAFPGGCPATDNEERARQVDSLPDVAWEPFFVIHHSFEQWVAGGERVMLTRLHDWYHSQPVDGAEGPSRTIG